MSAEGKKKRGVSGASNGKTCAFRYGAWQAQWQRDGAVHPKRGKPEPGGAWDKPLKGYTYAEACSLERNG